jgi:hypothetical protein
VGRQRFIHPEIWSDPTIGRLVPLERLFFIGCFSNADDEGRLLGSPAYLRSTIFPYDDMTIVDVQGLRDNVLSVCHNLVLYAVSEVEYMAFLKWSLYQKPKYPKPSKLPAPPEDAFPQNRGNHGEAFPQNSPLGRVGMDRDGVGLGMERNEEVEGEDEFGKPAGELVLLLRKRFPLQNTKKAGGAARAYEEFHAGLAAGYTFDEYRAVIEECNEPDLAPWDVTKAVKARRKAQPNSEPKSWATLRKLAAEVAEDD